MALLVSIDDWHYSRARLKGRLTDAAEFLQTFKLEDELVSEWVYLFFFVFLVIGDELGVMPDGEMREKRLFDNLLGNGLKHVSLLIQNINLSFLDSIFRTSSSTLMMAHHMSIFSAGERIHLRTLSSN